MQLFNQSSCSSSNESTSAGGASSRPARPGQTNNDDRRERETQKTPTRSERNTQEKKQNRPQVPPPTRAVERCLSTRCKRRRSPHNSRRGGWPGGVCKGCGGHGEPTQASKRRRCSRWISKPRRSSTWMIKWAWPVNRTDGRTDGGGEAEQAKPSRARN